MSTNKKPVSGRKFRPIEDEALQREASAAGFARAVVSSPRPDGRVVLQFDDAPPATPAEGAPIPPPPATRAQSVAGALGLTVLRIRALTTTAGVVVMVDAVCQAAEDAQEPAA